MRLGVEAALVDGRLVPGDVEVAGGRIGALGLTGGPRRGIAAPGLVDLQVNGFAGVDLYGADADGWRRAGEALLATGVTAFAPTFISAPEAATVEALRGLPRGVGARVIGAHLEGPFLSPQRPGTHDPANLCAPDAALLARLLDAGPVALMTLAPELPGAPALVDALHSRGVTVSAGHSDATAEQAHAVFDRGVRTVTHLFNAMPPFAHRAPGLAGAALARPDVVVQAIVDGHHVAWDAVRVAWAAAAGRFALVTDAMAAAAAPDGEYRLGRQTVRAQGGVVRNAAGGLAGSALTLIEAVRNLHRLGAPLEAALTAATAVPARVLGRDDVGRLAIGAPADVVVLDDRLEVVRVLVAGAQASPS